jgi:hypothetical protein
MWSSVLYSVLACRRLPVFWRSLHSLRLQSTQSAEDHDVKQYHHHWCYNSLWVLAWWSGFIYQLSLNSTNLYFTGSFNPVRSMEESWNCSVCVAARLWARQPRDQGSIPGRARPALESCPSGRGGCLCKGYSSVLMKLTTHLCLVPGLRMVELYLHSPNCLHGMVFS